MNPPFRLLAPHPRICCSKTATSIPRRANVLAAERPVYPPPIITTSLEAGSGERGMPGSEAVSVQRQRSVIRAEPPLPNDQPRIGFDCRPSRLNLNQPVSQ